MRLGIIFVGYLNPDLATALGARASKKTIMLLSLCRAQSKCVNGATRLTNWTSLERDETIAILVRAERDSFIYDLPPDRYAREAAEAMTLKSFKHTCMQVAVFLMGPFRPSPLCNEGASVAHNQNNPRNIFFPNISRVQQRTLQRYHL